MALTGSVDVSYTGQRSVVGLPSEWLVSSLHSPVNENKFGCDGDACSPLRLDINHLPFDEHLTMARQSGYVCL